MRLKRMRSCRVVTLCEVVVCEGEGMGETEIYREVTYYYREDGSLAAVRDPVDEMERTRPAACAAPAP